MGSSPGDSYPYGAAMWAQFLGERYGAVIIRQIWERCQSTTPNKSPHFLDATEAILQERYQTTLEAAWTEFTRWNLFTGGRAVAKSGYQQSANYPEVRLEDEVRGLGDTQVMINGLSARYVRINPQLGEKTRLRVELIDESDSPATGTAYVVKLGQPGAAQPFPSGKVDLDVDAGDKLYVIVTGAQRGGASHALTVRVSLAPKTIPPDVPQMPKMGCAVLPTAKPKGWGFVVLGLAGWLFARRRARQNP
jgi:hypothetical protein